MLRWAGETRANFEGYQGMPSSSIRTPRFWEVSSSGMRERESGPCSPRIADLSRFLIACQQKERQQRRRRRRRKLGLQAFWVPREERRLLDVLDSQKGSCQPLYAERKPPMRGDPKPEG